MCSYAGKVQCTMIWCFARGGGKPQNLVIFIIVAVAVEATGETRFQIVNIFLQWPLDQNLFFAPKPFTLPKYFGICKPMTENVKVWKVYLVMSWLSQQWNGFKEHQNKQYTTETSQRILNDKNKFSEKFLLPLLLLK